MADPVSYSKLHFPRKELQSTPNITKTKSSSSSSSFTRLLCKLLCFLLFLVCIPLFPSRAPDFIDHPIFTKFWELAHLLFIGLAVSYGLICRRNVEDFDFEPPPNSNVDDSQSGYVSRIFHVSPIFEDGSENLSGYDEKNDYQNWNSQYYRGESMVTVTHGHEPNKTGSQYYKGEPMVDVANDDDQQNKTETLGAEIGFENEIGDSNVIQACNFQYFRSESMVVVSEPNYPLNESANLGQVSVHKPLGLPIRSLRSRVRNPDGPHFSNGRESGLSLEESSNDSGRSIQEKDFGDMGPVNLEERFNETVVLSSQIPQRSVSERMEIRENVGSFAGRPSHFRPFSVDETQFESFKSDSFRSESSFSSQGSSVSYSPTRLSPPHSVSSELPNLEVEELGEKKGYRASYPPASQSSSTRKVDAPLNAFHLRRYSSGSLFKKDSHRNSKEETKDLGGKRKEDSLGSKESGKGSLRSDKQPATLVKALSRGKSVRTIRAIEFAAEAAKAGETSKNLVDDKVGKTCNEAKSVNMEKDEMKRVLESMSIGNAKKNADVHFGVSVGNAQKNADAHFGVSVGNAKKNCDAHLPKQTVPNHHKKEMQLCSKSVTVGSEEDSENEIGNFQIRSHEDVVADSGNDTGNDPSEVDKKAGEFIAKFKEQIRLQKVASIERSKGKQLLHR